MSAEIEALRALITPLDPAWEQAARDRLDQLTKPSGSLGLLEDVAARVAAIDAAGGGTRFPDGAPRPAVRRPTVLAFAGDHGVVAAGVSAWPQSVTGQMLANFAAGGAAINALARAAGAELHVVDVGSIGPTPAGVRDARIANGTADSSVGPAMSRGQAIAALRIGSATAADAITGGANLVALGEMGIGNTTAAAVITSAITGQAIERTVGRGAGLDSDGLARKREVVAKILDRHRSAGADPLDLLAAVGGFEIGAIAGAIIACAAAQVPVVLDGYICGAAALIAVGLAPETQPYLLAGHCSAEPGHQLVLDHLGLAPLLRLDLRLGEGTGAALALPIVGAAVLAYLEMATFTEAGVGDA